MQEPGARKCAPRCNLPHAGIARGRRHGPLPALAGQPTLGRWRGVAGARVSVVAENGEWRRATRRVCVEHARASAAAGGDLPEARADFGGEGAAGGGAQRPDQQDAPGHDQVKAVAVPASTVVPGPCVQLSILATRLAPPHLAVRVPASAGARPAGRRVPACVAAAALFAAAQLRHRSLTHAPTRPASSSSRLAWRVLAQHPPRRRPLTLALRPLQPRDPPSAVTYSPRRRRFAEGVLCQTCLFFRPAQLR
mmetsp:Transcript_62593/g.147199  ORF Transcript_62593/g.147199 Transcript_62593/m.147199 type:complete len:251 (+) Transcript_62593:4097-4849(+)